MARRILKYPIKIEDEVEFAAPAGRILRHIGHEGDFRKLVIWIEVLDDQETKLTAVKLRIFKTGQPIPDDLPINQYWRTVQGAGGLVWHVWHINP